MGIVAADKRVSSQFGEPSLNEEDITRHLEVVVPWQTFLTVPVKVEYSLCGSLVLPLCFSDGAWSVT